MIGNENNWIQKKERLLMLIGKKNKLRRVKKIKFTVQQIIVKYRYKQ